MREVGQVAPPALAPVAPCVKVVWGLCYADAVGLVRLERVKRPGRGLWLFWQSVGELVLFPSTRFSQRCGWNAVALKGIPGFICCPWCC